MPGAELWAGVLTAAEAGGDLVERRTRPVLRRVDRPADVDETCDALVVLDPECIERMPVIGVPLGDPGRRIAERVRRKDQTHGGGAGGEHLLPFRDFHVRAGTTDDRDDEWRARKARALVFDLLGLG